MIRLLHATHCLAKTCAPYSTYHIEKSLGRSKASIKRKLRAEQCSLVIHCFRHTAMVRVCFRFNHVIDRNNKTITKLIYSWGGYNLQKHIKLLILFSHVRGLLDLFLQSSIFLLQARIFRFQRFNIYTSWGT